MIDFIGTSLMLLFITIFTIRLFQLNWKNNNPSYVVLLAAFIAFLFAGSLRLLYLTGGVEVYNNFWKISSVIITGGLFTIEGIISFYYYPALYIFNSTGLILMYFSLTKKFKRVKKRG